MGRRSQRKEGARQLLPRPAAARTATVVTLDAEAAALRELHQSLAQSPRIQLKALAMWVTIHARQIVVRLHLERAPLWDAEHVPATPQTVARPHASRAASTAWRMTPTLPVASKV